MTATRIPVRGEQPYDVVVGTGVLGELPALVGPQATSVMVIAPKGLDEISWPVSHALQGAGYQVHTAEVPAGEAAKDISVAAATLVPAGGQPDHPERLRRRRRRRGRHRPGRVRRRDLAARGAAGAGADHAAGHDRRRGGRQDRGGHPGGQEPGRRVPPARRGAGRPGCAGNAAAGRVRQRAGRDRQGRVHRRPGHPGADRGRPGGCPARRMASTAGSWWSGRCG